MPKLLHPAPQKPEFNLVITARFLADLRHGGTTDVKTLKKLLELVDAVRRDPFGGLGKPEALKGQRGTWSRRITGEHRLLYRVVGQDVHLLQGRYHY